MKKNLHYVIALMLGMSTCFTTKAQDGLPDGTTAPDWTLSDITSKSWHLYDLLDAGKIVVLDISATWCGPCWQYHNTGALDQFLAAQGPSGTDKAQVLFIEADGTTTSADLHGTGSNTQGDWVTGTTYPIIDPASPHAYIGGPYNVTYVPMILMICPNKKLYNISNLNIGTSQASSADLTADMKTKCPSSTTGIMENANLNNLNVFPNPATSLLNVDFNFTAAAKNVSLKLVNSIGEVVMTEALGNLNAGAQHHHLNIPSTVAKGLYFVSIQADGEKVITQKISVE